MNENENGQSAGRRELDVDMDALLGGDAQATGKVIDPGNYPATFTGYGKPFLLNGKFGPQKLFDLHFAIRDKEGDVLPVAYLCSVPDNPNKIHVRSNIFKALKSIDPSKFDKEGKRFNKGVNLKSFVGCNCMLTVIVNDNDFPKVDAIAQKVEGLKFPNKKESEVAYGEDIPF